MKQLVDLLLHLALTLSKFLGIKLLVQEERYSNPNPIKEMATHRMYSNIVQSDDDIIGLVAYGLYKKHKIEFFNKVRKDKGGAEPSESEIASFIQAASTESQIKTYQDQAERILMDVVANVTEEQIQQTSREMLESYETKISNAVKKETPSWIKTVGLNVLGTFAFSLLITLIVIIGNFSERGTKSIADKVVSILNAEASEKASVAPNDTIMPPTIPSK